MDAHKRVLITLIEEHTSKINLIEFIPESVGRLLLFNHVTDDLHEIYLILHQLVPQSLVDLIQSYTFKHVNTRKIIFDFFLSIQQHLYQEIWPKHNSNLRAWEKSHNISKKNKKRVKGSNTSHHHNSLNTTSGSVPPPGSTSVNGSSVVHPPLRVHPFFTTTETLPRASGAPIRVSIRSGYIRFLSGYRLD